MAGRYVVAGLRVEGRVRALEGGEERHAGRGGESGEGGRGATRPTMRSKLREASAAVAAVRRERIGAGRSLSVAISRGVRPLLVVAHSASGCSRIKSSRTAGSLWRSAAQ